VWASVGLHPHDAKNGLMAMKRLKGLLEADGQNALPSEHSFEVNPPLEVLPQRSAGIRLETDPTVSSSKDSVRQPRQLQCQNVVVAIGECGLDYFYDNSPREQQFDMLHAQLELAREYDLPVIFHVREAFGDFWPIFDQYPGLKGVLHSFTDTKQNMEMALERGLCIGVNGISTFTKVDTQKEMFANIPLENLLLETDAPFLTPTPKRGSINEPAYVKYVAQHAAQVRGISVEEVAQATSRNAASLFAL
jgi:TatD DNase family protein